MDFYEALGMLGEGHHISSHSWGDPGVYGLLDGGNVRIKMGDGKVYDWIITEADLVLDDWEVVG